MLGQRDVFSDLILKNVTSGFFSMKEAYLVCIESFDVVLKIWDPLVIAWFAFLDRLTTTDRVSTWNFGVNICASYVILRMSQETISS